MWSSSITVTSLIHVTPSVERLQPPIRTKSSPVLRIGGSAHRHRVQSSGMEPNRPYRLRHGLQEVPRNNSKAGKVEVQGCFFTHMVLFEYNCTSWSMLVFVDGFSDFACSVLAPHPSKGSSESSTLRQHCSNVGDRPSRKTCSGV